MKRKITSNVLEDVARRIKGEGTANNRKKALVVLNGSDIELDKKIQLIKDIKTQGIEISLAFSFMAEKLLDKEKIIRVLSPRNIYGEEDVFKLKEIAMEYDLIIDPNITINTLSKVSLGMIDSFIATLLWTFIYKGKSVYLDFNSVRNYLGEETKIAAVKGLVENHILTLKEMGVIEIHESTYLENISGLKDDPENKKTIENQSYLNKESNNKRVITQRDILSLSTKSLILEKGTIISPLAKDKAREMNIKIEVK